MWIFGLPSPHIVLDLHCTDSNTRGADVVGSQGQILKQKPIHEISHFEDITHLAMLSMNRLTI